MSDRGLVLGGTGGLGAVAAAVLQSQGFSVWVTGRRPPRIPDFSDPVRSTPLLGNGPSLDQSPDQPVGEQMGAPTNPRKVGNPAGEQARELVGNPAGERAGGDQVPALSVKPLNWIPHEYRSPEHTLAAVEEALGSPLNVSYLVCNFGPFLEAPVSTMQGKDWRFLVEANLMLPGMLVSAVLPEMIQRGFGRIVLFGATGTDQVVGRRLTAGYQAAKTGLGVLAKSVALEAGHHNVTCNVVCPGYVETEYYTEAMKAKAKRRTPGGMLNIPQDFFSLFKLLLSADTTYINGAIISSAQGL
ncbi:MAG: SDR family oxidoreductase [Spirochaetales bacterium]|nr:SDR family oxidoreductase [Spirochaetales bacterium]